MHKILNLKTVAVDAGNRTINACDDCGAVTLLMPSVHIDAVEHEEYPSNPKNTVIVRYIKGSATREGDHYVVGELASELQGGIKTFNGDKAELAGRLVLSAIGSQIKAKSSVVIEKLVICTPNKQQDSKVAYMTECLSGKHVFIRNGVELDVTVKEVICQPETLGAYKFAKDKGLFRWVKSPNGILDLGGKTSIGQIYLPSGMAPNDGRVVLPGTYELAQLIAKSDPALRRLDNDPDLGLIMDGVASQDFMYGLDVCFKDTYDAQLSKWIDGITKQIKLKWEGYSKELAEVLVIGGSAPLANELVIASEGRFKIANNHTSINVQGMGLGL